MKATTLRFCGNYVNDVCCLLIAYGIYVGAYGIRPICHRMNRAANRYTKLHNRRNSGRMQYDHTAVQFIVCLIFAYLCGTLHTPCINRINRICKPPPQHRKTSAILAYAIRPYGGANDWLFPFGGILPWRGVGIVGNKWLSLHTETGIAPAWALTNTDTVC